MAPPRMDPLEIRIEELSQTIAVLMPEVDALFAAGDPSADLLDAELEELLEELEGRLAARDEEGGEAEDCYDGAGVEEQLVALWASWCAGGGHFRTEAEIAAHLRFILDEAQRGFYSPSGFLGAEDAALLRLAEDLYRERQALLHRLRSAGSVPKGLPPPVRTPLSCLPSAVDGPEKAARLAVCDPSPPAGRSGSRRLSLSLPELSFVRPRIRLGQGQALPKFPDVRPPAGRSRHLGAP